MADLQRLSCAVSLVAQLGDFLLQAVQRLRCDAVARQDPTRSCLLVHVNSEKNWQPRSLKCLARGFNHLADRIVGAGVSKTSEGSSAVQQVLKMFVRRL